jgi:TolA-binding protein
MDLLYGELDQLSEAAALRHLHHCTRCRDIWGHLRTTRELSEIPLEEPPADLFESILAAEENAHKSFPVRERVSRAISVLAGYAMRPQLAMAALLLLMIGSSLIFVRAEPSGGGQVSVTELGTPHSEPAGDKGSPSETLVFDGDRDTRPRMAGTALDEEEIADPDGEQDEAREKLPSDRQTYSEAMAAYQEGRYAEAERLFSEVASTGGERAASAALHEGHAARNGSGCQRAAALYDAVASRYTGGTVADEASWHAASCYRAMGQLKRASAHYVALKDRPAFAARAETALAEIESQLAVARSETTKEAAPPTTEMVTTSKPAAKSEPSAAAPAEPEAAPEKPAAPSPTKKTVDQLPAQ